MDEDFLTREQAILGGSFSPTGAQGTSSIDFDAAVSAFPALDDFDGQVPIGQAAPSSLGNGLGEGFGDFEPVPSFNAPSTTVTDVKVTGDDELGQFESQFPDLGVVCALLTVLMVDCLSLTTGRTPHRNNNKPTNHPSSLSLSLVLHSKPLQTSCQKRSPRLFGRPHTSV